VEEGRGWGRGAGGEMTQTMYAHVNKRIIKKNLLKIRQFLIHIQGYWSLPVFSSFLQAALKILAILLTGFLCYIEK
jgi:hypothetical protein